MTPHFQSAPPQVVELLRELSKRKELSAFSLGGGTSLALRFGHRLSVDLDFFTTRPFDPEVVFESLDKPSAIVLNRAVNTLTLECGGVKVDFLRHGYQLLEPPETHDGIPMLSLRDVAAMKLNAIVNRGSKKDFFDLARLLEERPIGELLIDFQQKYPNSDRFMVVRSLVYFGDANREPDPMSLIGASWPSVKERITTAIRSLR